MISAFEAFQPLYNLIVFDEASLNAYLFDKFCRKFTCRARRQREKKKKRLSDNFIVIFLFEKEKFKAF